MKNKEFKTVPVPVLTEIVSVLNTEWVRSEKTNRKRNTDRKSSETPPGGKKIKNKKGKDKEKEEIKSVHQKRSESLLRGLILSKNKISTGNLILSGIPKP